MDIVSAAFVSLFALIAVSWHMQRSTLRKFVGYAFALDLFVHISVFALFMGTSTLGLLQAELMAIFFTITVRTYRYLFGYSRLRREGALLRWRTTKGKWA